MTEPILVVHGVNNHDLKPFLEQVSALQRVVGPAAQLLPVHWGDLGGQSQDLADCLPLYSNGRWTVRSESGEIRPVELEASEVRAFVGDGLQALDNEHRARIVAEALATQSVVRGEATRAVEPVREAVLDQLPSTKVLQHVDDAALLRFVGQTIDEVLSEVDLEAAADAGLDGTYAVRGEEETRAIADRVRKIAQKVMRGIDDALGRFVGTQLGRVNQAVREKLANPAAATLGDVISYQGNAARIQKRLFDAIDERAAGWGTKDRPISVIAHSLGGVISFDAAVRPTPGNRRLHIKHFVTFGSQAAFFHIVDPRRPDLEVYRRDKPVALPAGSVETWTNLWDPLDPLAFTAGTVFRLPNGTKPKDEPVEDSASDLFEAKLFPHSGYWTSDELARVLKQLRQG